MGEVSPIPSHCASIVVTSTLRVNSTDRPVTVWIEVKLTDSHGRHSHQLGYVKGVMKTSVTPDVMTGRSLGVLMLFNDAWSE